MSDFGLGAHPSPPDARDFTLTLEDIPLPKRFINVGMGPLMNQGVKPECVAYSHVGLKQWEEKRDGNGVVPFDPDWLYRACKAIDGIAGEGTNGRAAMRILKGSGCAPIAHPQNAHLYKIAAYYAVPLDLVSMKRALQQYGPITVGGAWYNAWFKPVKGILPAAGGGIAGGHETLIYGYDDDVSGGSFVVRNSWGVYPGSTNGNFWAPYSRYLPSLWEAWKAVDVKGDGA